MWPKRRRVRRITCTDDESAAEGDMAAAAEDDAPAGAAPAQTAPIDAEDKDMAAAAHSPSPSHQSMQPAQPVQVCVLTLTPQSARISPSSHMVRSHMMRW